ncbi:helix-turn-helix domain-containing protein [Salinibacterium sp. PAMC 21357]|uniref:helix-turn-helix domain-containing protein n=1 Tax=Salinibacterium sp. PAMC 21357 TaxID=1112215 RepID=UPI0002895916|nr:helix-turn-helix domain-containing protein [Salinibacterium sp. PAMC 21357]
MAPADENETTGIRCRLDELLTKRGMTLTRLSEIVGVSVVNLSILKNDRARAIRFSTLYAVCAALECEVGELLVTVESPESATTPSES